MQLSWSKSLVRKWFNIKGKSQDFHADDAVRISEIDREAATVKKSKTERLLKENPSRDRRGTIDLDLDPDPTGVTETQEYRIFVATWNVGGKSPPSCLNLDDWLHTSPPVDIYVLGFQEIVPLNAGNVLGTEDSGPARKWVSLIRKTLNNLPSTSSTNEDHITSPAPNPIVDMEDDFEGPSLRPSNASFFHRHSFQSLCQGMDVDMMDPQSRNNRRYSVYERVSYGSRPNELDTNFRWGGSFDDENTGGDSISSVFVSPVSNGYDPPPSSMVERRGSTRHSRYRLVANKQMVGIFLTVWMRSEIRDGVKNMKVSCVGRGLMGYLGNKGSISISMSLHQTSFCFICSHLTSGQKEGDELRRNSDVMEILRKTRFPRVHRQVDGRSPETIFEHDRIIWLGDLNYRVALSYRTAKALVEMRNWKALLEKDQLRIEKRCHRVFEGWNEGRIYFPPTYKYSSNSDRYSGDDLHLKEKRRTPAWCDRILWYGRGLNQLSYIRGELRFSDHRPVYSIFTAEVESINHDQVRNISWPISHVVDEELLPYSHGYT